MALADGIAIAEAILNKRYGEASRLLPRFPIVDRASEIRRYNDLIEALCDSDIDTINFALYFVPPNVTVTDTQIATIVGDFDKAYASQGVGWP